MIAEALLAPAIAEVLVAVIVALLLGIGAYVGKYLKRMNAVLNRTEAQVTPNGGNSDRLGDRARRTEETVSRMENRLLNHEERLIDIEAHLIYGIDLPDDTLPKAPRVARAIVSLPPPPGAAAR